MSDTITFGISATPREHTYNLETRYSKQPQSFSKKSKLAAFCASQGCISLSEEIYSVVGLEYAVRKDVNKSTVDCPDCGYALFWSKRWTKKGDLK